MDVVLTREHLMGIAQDCFYKNGRNAITVPSFFNEQKFAFQIEKIEEYSYEISSMLRRVKHERVEDGATMSPKPESELGWFTTLGWLRYTENGEAWCSIYDADLLCALGIAAGCLEVAQPKAIFQDNLEMLPLHILLRRSSAKPLRAK